MPRRSGSPHPVTGCCQPAASACCAPRCRRLAERTRSTRPRRERRQRQKGEFALACLPGSGCSVTIADCRTPRIRDQSTPARREHGLSLRSISPAHAQSVLATTKNVPARPRPLKIPCTLRLTTLRTSSTLRPSNVPMTAAAGQLEARAVVRLDGLAQAQRREIHVRVQIVFAACALFRSNTQNTRNVMTCPYGRLLGEYSMRGPVAAATLLCGRCYPDTQSHTRGDAPCYDASTCLRCATTAVCAGPVTPAVAQTLPFTVTELANFDVPWAMAFLPDGRCSSPSNAAR